MDARAGEGRMGRWKQLQSIYQSRSDSLVRFGYLWKVWIFPLLLFLQIPWLFQNLIIVIHTGTKSPMNCFQVLSNSLVHVNYYPSTIRDLIIFCHCFISFIDCRRFLPVLNLRLPQQWTLPFHAYLTSLHVWGITWLHGRDAPGVSNWRRNGRKTHHYYYWIRIDFHIVEYLRYQTLDFIYIYCACSKVQHRRVDHK